MYYCYPPVYWADRTKPIITQSLAAALWLRVYGWIILGMP